MRELLYCFPQSQAPGSWSCQEGQTTDGECASLSTESALQPGGPGRLEKSERLGGGGGGEGERWVAGTNLIAPPAQVSEELGEKALYL